MTPLAVRRGKCTEALIMSATHNAVGKRDAIRRHPNRVTSESVRSPHVFEIFSIHVNTIKLITRTEKYFDKREEEGPQALNIFLVKKNIKTAENIRLDSPLRSTIYDTSPLWIRASVIGASILKRSLILTCLFPLESAEEKYVPGSYLQHGLTRSPMS